MHPKAFETQAEQAAVCPGAIKQQVQRKLARRRIGEQRWRQDRSTGIDERHHLVLVMSAQAAIWLHGVVAAAGIADAAGGRREQEKHVHCRSIERLGEPHEVRLDAVEPHRVGIDQEEWRRAKLRQRLGDAAAGAEQGPALVGDDDPRPLAPGEMAFKRVGKIVHVDHGALDAGVGQSIERVVDQRFAAHLHQRLGDVAVVRAHPRAKPGRKHHRARRHHMVSPPVNTYRFVHHNPFKDGTFAAYQALSGASAGCANDRCK
jgi:hypothetical protein